MFLFLTLLAPLRSSVNWFFPCFLNVGPISAPQTLNKPIKCIFFYLIQLFQRLFSPHSAPVVTLCARKVLTECHRAKTPQRLLASLLSLYSASSDKAWNMLCCYFEWRTVSEKVKDLKWQSSFFFLFLTLMFVFFPILFKSVFYCMGSNIALTVRDILFLPSFPLFPQNKCNCKCTLCTKPKPVQVQKPNKGLNTMCVLKCESIRKGFHGFIVKKHKNYKAQNYLISKFWNYFCNEFFVIMNVLF